jgi:hypothetical protein
MTPISETVQAALHFLTHYKKNSEQYSDGFDEMLRQITEMDPNLGFPEMTAAAWFLAAEVKRLREELNNN